MKKRVFIIVIVIFACTAVIIDFFSFGYLEHIFDNTKIDRSKTSYSKVITLSIGPHGLAPIQYENIIQIKSDKTITENTFRVIRRVIRETNNRTYDDKIIRGKSRVLSDDEYNRLLSTLGYSDFESIQNGIDNGGMYLDGNSTYITIKDESSFIIIGGHCAEYKDKRFDVLMNYILDLR